MANVVNQIDFQKTLAAFLATAVSNGTWNDVLESLKVDDPGFEATATQIDVASAQLWGNIMDDYLQATYGAHYKAIKTWVAADAATRDVFGSDDDLSVNDICWVQDVQQFWYVVSVDGAAASTWAAVTGGGGITLNAEYRFSTTITMADPGNGRLRFDNATQSAATAMAISKTTDNGKAVGGILVNLINAGWQFYLQNQTDDTKWHRVNITSAPTDNGTWVQYVIAVSASGVALGNNDKCILIFVEDAAAAAVPTSHGPRWEKGAAIDDSDPGAGKYKYNHADQALATFLYVSDDNFDGQNMDRAWVQDMGLGDELLLQQEGTPGNTQRYIITAPTQNGTGYRKIPISVPVGGIAGSIATGAKAGFTFWVNASNLGKVLAKGNTTAGSDILVSFGDKIKGTDDLNLEGGDGGTGDPGEPVTTRGGVGEGVGNGGAAQVIGGVPGATGTGGVALVRGGPGGVTSGAPGDVAIEGADALNNNENGGKVIIKGGAPHGTGLRGLPILQNEGNDDEAVFTATTTGSNSASASVYNGDRNPNGNVEAFPGDFYWRNNGASSVLYQHIGAAQSDDDWAAISYQPGQFIFESTDNIPVADDVFNIVKVSADEFLDTEVVVDLKVASASDLSIDVMVDGVSVFVSGFVTITAAAFTATKVTNLGTRVKNKKITVNVEAGSAGDWAGLSVSYRGRTITR